MCSTPDVRLPAVTASMAVPAATWVATPPAPSSSVTVTAVAPRLTTTPSAADP